MRKIAVIYWSMTGNTETMANAIAEGVVAAGGEADVTAVTDISVNDALEYDGLALGCPAMGAEVLEEIDFEPWFTEIEGRLSGKRTALFGSYGWGDGQWMRDWQARAESAGASLVADGLTVNEAPDEHGLAQCRALGAALAG